MNDNSSQPNRMNQPQLDATMAFDARPNTSGVSEDGSESPSNVGLTKQERDLAFASVMLRSGVLTERQLVQAVAEWTTYGDQTLADHLIKSQLLAVEKRDELQAASNRELERIGAEITRQGDWTRTEQDRFALDRLDGSGKLSKLLGIADASVLSTNEMEARKINVRYTLLRRLGQGGIGTVWLARDENLHRYVALKELTSTAVSGETAQAHFRREAEITGKLEHPGIVPIYQYGTDEATGRSFYVMRFMGKRTLQDAITEYHERREAGNKDKLLKHRLLTAFVNVCQAVAHAHSKKVVHRDLKPENIAIDSFGQIVLLDWGLAKINEETGMHEVKGKAEPGDLHSIGSAQTGRVLGTPLFMAPEQAAGRLDEVDELTDVYGLGGVLYAILTGVGPHQSGLETQHGGATEVFSKIVSNNVVPPTELADDVQPELNAICMKALASKRYLRYESATDLAKDVERYRAGAPVTAYNTPLRSRVRRWMAAHPTLAQLMLLSATLFILGGAAIGYTARQGRLALADARYHSLTEFARELNLNLKFETQELVQDVRFLTDFPLTRVVAATRSSEAAVDGKVFDGENEIDLSANTPDEWIARQGRLMEGILEANPAYLVASNIQFEKPQMTELVRSERIATGMKPRLLPKQQLYSGEHPESDNDFYSLRPGEVILKTANLLSEDVPTKNRSPLVVAAVCPIFDEAGKFFGINVIEFDLRSRLKTLLQSSANRGIEVFITDANGTVAMAWKNGEAHEPEVTQSIVDQYPQLRELFSSESDDTVASDSKRMYATKVRIGPAAQIAIVTRVAE
jgi:serine/threonine protein kinase